MKAFALAIVLSVLGCKAGEPPVPTDPYSPATWQFYLDRLEKINTMPPNGQRNLVISQSYQEMGRLFTPLAGYNWTAPQGNWPTVAAWASASVGAGIRRLWLNDWLEEVTETWPRWLVDALELAPDVADAVFNRTLEETSLYLSGGNLIVFQQIGGSFARFGVHFANLTAPDENRLQGFLNTFGPSDTQLAQAMESYYNAMFAATPENRTQWTFLANMLAGLQEQERLQPYLFGAFQSNFTMHLFGQNVTLDLAPTITKTIMTLTFPSEIFVVAEDVPRRPWDGGLYAAGLDNITLTAARTLYLDYVPQLDGYSGTGAQDWDQLSQRMRYVFPLFRSRQDDLRLSTCSLLSQAQVDQIWNGTVPSEDSFCLQFMTCCTDNEWTPPRAHQRST